MRPQHAVTAPPPYRLDPSNTDAKNELTFAVNTMAHFWMAKAFLGPMVSKNSGNFVVVASMAAIVGAPAMADYSASKASAKAFAEALALELKHLRADQVKVTCICPSHVNTQLFGGFNTGPGSKALLLEPEDVAKATVEVSAAVGCACACVFICSVRRMLIAMRVLRFGPYTYPPPPTHTRARTRARTHTHARTRTRANIHMLSMHGTQGR